MNKNTSNRNEEIANHPPSSASAASEEFGDVNQYRELSAIGTGEIVLYIQNIFQDNKYFIGLRSVYHLFHFCVFY